MLQANKHISLVCGEPGSLSTFNIILLSERGFHCLLSITSLLLWSNNACQTRVCLQTSDIRIWCHIGTLGLRLLAPGSCQLSVHWSLLRPVLSQLQGIVIFTILSNTCSESCHLVPGDPWHVTQLPRVQMSHCTDHYNVLAWVSPRDWRRWELSGGQGRVYTCTHCCTVLPTVQSKRKVLLFLKYFSYESIHSYNKFSIHFNREE